jgi:hypothetical protein
MEVFESLDNAINEGLNLRSRKRLSCANDFIQRLVLAKLQKYVNVVLILKIMKELDNIFVV